MRLRNKKTGGIFDVAFHSSYNDGKIAIGVEVDSDQRYPKCNFSDYESLEEFCENWEDVKETLIKDEKVRRVFREWADLIGAERFRVEHLCKYGRTIITSTDISANPSIELPGYIGEDLKTYTKIELVGEEIE